MKKMTKERLYNYIFWYNPFEELWYAIHRESELQFFNGHRDKSIFYKSKEHSTLVELIIRDQVLTELK